MRLRRNFFQWWSEEVDAFHYFIALVILSCTLAVVGAVASLHYSNCRETYEAWCKATSVEITYEEWRRLKMADLLPGQTKTKTVVIPVITR